MTMVEYNHKLGDVFSMNDVGPYYINSPHHLMKNVFGSTGPTISSVEHVAYTKI